MNVDNLIYHRCSYKDNQSFKFEEGAIYRIEALQRDYDTQEYIFIFRKIGNPVDDRSDFVNIKFE